jgi:hypothetical protein
MMSRSSKHGSSTREPLLSSDSESSIVSGSSMNRNYLIDVLTPSTNAKKNHDIIDSPSTDISQSTPLLPSEHASELKRTSTLPATPSEIHLMWSAMQKKLEHSKDQTHQLQLNLNTSQHDLNASLMYQEQLEMKLTQIKEINSCLRKKHGQYEKTIELLKHEILDQKNTRKQAAILFTNERAIQRKELEDRREEMETVKLELNKVKILVEKMIIKEQAAKQNMASSFVIGIGVGIVSLLLPRQFFK